MKNGMFEVGDILIGNKDNLYGITNEDMTKGKVINVSWNGLEIKILEHKDIEEIGKTYYDLNPDCFTLVQDVNKNPLTTFTITTDMDTFVDLTTDKGKSYTSKCMACDTFDLKTGVDLAIDRMKEAENAEKMPKYVRVLVDAYGLKKGDIAKVLTPTVEDPSYLYVVCPNESGYLGTLAKDPSVLEGTNFALLNLYMYEPVTIYD